MDMDQIRRKILGHHLPNQRNIKPICTCQKAQSLLQWTRNITGEMWVQNRTPADPFALQTMSLFYL